MSNYNQRKQASKESLRPIGYGWQRVRNMLSKWTRSESRGVGMLVTLSETIFGKQAINARNSSSAYLLVHYVLRLIVLVLCLLGCFVQIGTIMSLYFNYPAIVFVDLHTMEKLLLPAITICNENR